VTSQTPNKDRNAPFLYRKDRSAFSHSGPWALLNLLLCFATTAFCLHLVMTARLSTELRVFAVVLTVLIAGVTVRYFGMAMASEPVLVVDEVGIQIPRLGEGTIPWHEIRKVRVRKFKFVLISFEVDDPWQYAPPASTIHGKWLRIISHLGRPPLSVDATYVEGRAEGILAAIEHYSAQASEPSSSRR